MNRRDGDMFTTAIAESAKNRTAAVRLWQAFARGYTYIPV